MPNNALCGFCQKPFEKKRRTQRYCSSHCQERAWVPNNREKHNARVRKRRAEKPDWYREHEPLYQKTYRTKVLSTRPWRYMLRSRRDDAERKQIPFDLTDEWAAARWTNRCEITGLEFRPNTKPGPHPFSASLDRINPAFGYTQSNSRFILFGCNAIKGVGTDWDMLEIARAIIKAARTG